MNKFLTWLKTCARRMQTSLLDLLRRSQVSTWLKTSNRYKHLIGGFIVGLLALHPYAAIYAAAVAASCLELKDKLHGCQ